MEGEDDNFETYVTHQAEAAELVRKQFNLVQQTKARINDLEEEVAAWRGACRAANIEKDAALKEVKVLNGADPLAMCLLDGDGYIFAKELLIRGRDGGREAALALTRQITSFADKKLDGLKCQVICTIFFNKAGMSKILSEVGYCTPEIFNNFVLGLNAAHPLFTMTDVGSQKEAADAKFREQLRLYARLPSCKVIFAGCAHDGGYVSPLQTLETEGLMSKIYLLKGYDEVAFELKRLNLKTISFDGIFETKKLNAFANNNNNNNFQYSNSNNTPKIKPSASNGYLSSGPTSSSNHNSNNNNNNNNSNNNQSYKEKVSNNNGYISSKETGGYKSSGSYKENKSRFDSSNVVVSNSPIISNISLVPTSAMSSISMSKKVSSSNGIISSSISKTPSKFKFSKTDEETDFDKEDFTPVTSTKVKKMVILKPLDPKKIPPPCNNHYLLKVGCKRPDCKFAHNYLLTKKHLVALAEDAKKSPCMDALKGKKCAPDCFAGHACPGGTSCRYGEECRFSGPGMHRFKQVEFQFGGGGGLGAGGGKGGEEEDEDEDSSGYTDSSSD